MGINANCYVTWVIRDGKVEKMTESSFYHEKAKTKFKERKRLMKQEEVDNPIVAVLQILIAVVVGVVSVLLGILFKQKNDF